MSGLKTATADQGSVPCVGIPDGKTCSNTCDMSGCRNLFCSSRIESGLPSVIKLEMSSEEKPYFLLSDQATDSSTMPISVKVEKDAKPQHRLSKITDENNLSENFLPAELKVEILNDEKDEHLPFPCDLCCKSDKTSACLKNHKQNHTLFSCELCTKFFTTCSELNAHREVHTSERPFSCYRCSESFKRRSQLRFHKRIHTDGRPFYFLCVHCSKSFKTFSDLIAHKRAHKLKAT